MLPSSFFAFHIVGIVFIPLNILHGRLGFRSDGSTDFRQSKQKLWDLALAVAAVWLAMVVVIVVIPLYWLQQEQQVKRGLLRIEFYMQATASVARD